MIIIGLSDPPYSYYSFKYYFTGADNYLVSGFNPINPNIIETVDETFVFLIASLNAYENYLTLVKSIS